MLSDEMFGKSGLALAALLVVEPPDGPVVGLGLDEVQDCLLPWSGLELGVGWLLVGEEQPFFQTGVVADHDRWALLCQPLEGAVLGEAVQGVLEVRPLALLGLGELSVDVGLLPVKGVSGLFLLAISCCFGGRALPAFEVATGEGDVPPVALLAVGVVELGVQLEMCPCRRGARLHLVDEVLAVCLGELDDGGMSLLVLLQGIGVDVPGDADIAAGCEDHNYP